MGLIDRLLLREVLKTLLIILLVLALVLLSNTLVRILGEAASGLLSNEVLFLVVGLELVKAIGMIIPPAFFFAVLWVLGRMYRDSEMVGLQAAGFGYARLYRSIMIAAAPLFVLVLWLVMSVQPWSKAKVEELRNQQAVQAGIGWVRPGRFNEFQRGGLVVYTERRGPDGASVEGVFVQDRQGGQLGLVMAEKALQQVDPETGERFIVLRDGRRYEGQPGQLDYAIGRFDEYALRIPIPADEGIVSKRGAKPWADLLGTDSPKDWAEFHSRLSEPLALIAFAVLAVPLARSPPRAGVYGRMTVAVLLYFTFINLQRVAVRLLEDESIPAWLGVWWLPLLMLAVAGVVQLVDSNWFWTQRRRWRMRRA
jgi:lipopolysaccharide export system permease protein